MEKRVARAKAVPAPSRDHTERGNGDLPCKSELSDVPDGSEGRQEPACEEPAAPRHALGPLTHQRQQHHHRPPPVLSPQEIDEIAQLCLEVILEHEAQVAALAPEALTQHVTETLGDTQGAPASAEEANGGVDHVIWRKAAEPNREKNARRKIDRSHPFAAYAAFRPAFSQQLRVASEATSDHDMSQDAAFSEEVSTTTCDCLSSDCGAYDVCFCRAAM